MADKTQFRLVPVKVIFPPGWRRATMKEVELSKDVVTSILGTWTIAKLQDGWKIDGSGYGNKIKKYSSDEEISEQIAIKVREQVKEINVIRTFQVVPPGWRWATKEEVEKMKAEVVQLLSTWSIAKFWGGWKIDGSGYGNKIQRLCPNQEITEVVIVRPEEIEPDEKRYLDLHETCDKGHSMHHFHGRPPRKDLKTRYSATCRVCSKEALENQPYFMHCYECEYDVCTACAKLEVHFDQIEQTKCTSMHAMKIHRGYLRKYEPVACDECGEEKSLEKAPYFFHCLKCSESKCITCSRHDLFVKHQFAQFIDTDDNFVQVALEHNEERMRNELHLYMTPWDSEESAPAYVREVKCIKLDVRDKTVTYDDGIEHQVQNTYEKYDSWKEFVLRLVPMAKTAHVRVEYYNTHINKSGYPVYKSSSSGDAYCGRPFIGYEKKCTEEEQCDHCQHFTKKVKAEPKHHWWSGLVSFFSGVLDSIPVVGHIKGAVEYALGYKEAAKKSFEAATRTTVVMGAGVAGFCVGGPAGAVGAGIGAGVLFDAAESGVDSAIHGEWRPHGYMKEFTHIVQGDATWWDYASLGMDIVFDGLGGADGAAIFKGAIKEGAEKGMAGEIERDFDKKTAEDVAEKGGRSEVSGGTERPIPEFPPDKRVDYHLREHHWTPRGTGLDEADPMFREIYEELERLPKDDLEVRYGNKEDWVGDLKSWWRHYDNTASLKNQRIRDVRSDVHYKKSQVRNCEIRGSPLKNVQKGMPMAERRNVDHALECQLHVKINNSTVTNEFSKQTIESASVVLKKWQNSEANLWVVNAEMNIWKRDATNSLMRRELRDGTFLKGKDAYKKALVHHGFTEKQADKVVSKIQKALADLSTSAKTELNSEGQKLVRKFVIRARGELLLPLN